MRLPDGPGGTVPLPPGLTAPKEKFAAGYRDGLGHRSAPGKRQNPWQPHQGSLSYRAGYNAGRQVPWPAVITRFQDAMDAAPPAEEAWKEWRAWLDEQALRDALGTVDTPTT
jgi:hypothetical protein